MNAYNNSFNPYQSMMYGNQYASALTQPLTNPGQRQEVVRVNGQNGASAYQMPPNSSILLLDETAPIIWLKTTDGAGYPTVTPYDITPHQAEPTIDTKSLENRIQRLEDIVNEQLSQSNAKSSQPVKRVVTESKSN